jgi:hypothetical protein
MRTNEVSRSWVVYRMNLHGGGVGGNAVCEQREWELIEARHPGLHTLLHTGIKTEQEAEKLARTAAGDDGQRGAKKPPAPENPPPAG